MESVQRVKLAHGERQYGEAWRVNNEMTGHKRAKEGQVERHSPEYLVQPLPGTPGYSGRRSGGGRAVNPPGPGHRGWSLHGQ